MVQITYDTVFFRDFLHRDFDLPLNFHPTENEDDNTVRPRPVAGKVQGTPGILPRRSLDVLDAAAKEETLATIIEIEDTEPTTSARRKSDTLGVDKIVVASPQITPKKVAGGKWL